MALKALSVLFFLGLGVQLGHCVDSMQRQEVALDAERTFMFGWEIKGGSEPKIIIDVLVQTTGYVGFGLAPKANMEGGDLIIGGVFANGSSYFNDYHSKDKLQPMVDEHQDWFLEKAVENGSFTYLKFSRLLVTCDPDDISITGDTLNIIWSYGDTDTITYHKKRGGRQFNLLDPVEPPFDTSKLEVFEVRVNDIIPAEQTTYLCTVHKLKSFETKHYMVALEAFLGDENSVRHTHHFTATACNQDDPEVLQTLIDLEGTGGQLCYSGIYGKIKPKCNSILFGWAVGGKRIVLPEHLGVPVGEEKDQGKDQFILFEVHYDNPQKTPGLQFVSGFNLYFTSEAKQDEGSVLMVGADIIPSLMIPPKTDSYVVSGHCDPRYTKEYFPKDGINIVSVNMHSHLAGRQLKVRHFRGDVELPPLLSDDNYDFDFQQTRELPEEVKVMPGDQITMECKMSSTERNYTTFAGESTHDEMCHVFFFYYPRIDLLACRSGYPLEKLYKKFGIEEVDLDPLKGYPLDPTVIAPAKLNGQHVQKVINDFNWTAEYITDFEKDMRYGEHVAYFSISAVSSNRRAATMNYTKYPEAEEYIIPNECTVAFPDSTTADVPDSTTADVPDSTTADVPDSTTADVPDSTTADVPDSTTADVPDSTTADVPDSTTADVPDSTTADVPDSTTADVPDSTTADVPDSTTADVPDSTTADVPDSTTADVPDSTTADVPDSTTADVPDSTAGVAGNFGSIVLTVTLFVFSKLLILS